MAGVTGCVHGWAAGACGAPATRSTAVKRSQQGSPAAAHVEAGDDVGLVRAVLLGLGVDGPLQVVVEGWVGKSRGSGGRGGHACQQSPAFCAIAAPAAGSNRRERPVECRRSAHHGWWGAQPWPGKPPGLTFSVL